MSKLVKQMIALVICIIIAVLAFKLFKSNNEGENTQSTKQTEQSVPTANNSIANNDIVPQNNEVSILSNNTGSDNFVTGVENLPRSLQDTDVDGDIIIDGDGNLVPTRELRRLFDYFLSSLGEESSDTINARVEAYITHRTPEPAASDAVALYHRYVAYLKELTTVEDQYGSLQMRATQEGELDLNSVTQRQNDVDALRRQMFDTDVITAFFAADDRLQAYNVAMIEIQRNDILTDSQKEQARLDYVNRLPDSLIKDRVVKKQTMQTLMERTERMQKRNATDSELFAMRAEIVGIPAAERLAETDKINRDFDARFKQYQQLKAQILALDDSNTIKQEKLMQVIQQLFNEAEQKRLTGYEVMVAQ